MNGRMTGMLLASALALSPAAMIADEGSHSLEALVVQMADTPAEHAALAEHFRAKAEAARKAAKRHEGMASLTPVTFFVIVWGLINAFQVFDSPFILTTGGPGDASRTVVMYIYESGFRREG